MASADFCTVTARIAAGRAVRLKDVAASFFDTQRAARHGAGSWYPGGTNPGNVVFQSHRTRRRSPTVKDANCQCTNAAFTVGVEPVGFTVMCLSCLDSLGLDYAVSVRRLAHLHSGFLQTNPRG